MEKKKEDITEIWGKLNFKANYIPASEHQFFSIFLYNF